MRKINVLICDDQPEIVRETEDLLLLYEEQYGRAMRILGVTDYEEAKAYFLELMMPTEGEDHERAECVYIQLLHGLDEYSEEDE